MSKELGKGRKRFELQDSTRIWASYPQATPELEIVSPHLNAIADYLVKDVVENDRVVIWTVPEAFPLVHVVTAKVVEKLHPKVKHVNPERLGYIVHDPMKDMTPGISKGKIGSLFAQRMQLLKGATAVILLHQDIPRPETISETDWEWYHGLWTRKMKSVPIGDKKITGFTWPTLVQGADPVSTVSVASIEQAVQAFLHPQGEE